MDTEHEWYVRRAEPYGETFQVNCDTSADAIRIAQSWEDAGERGVATNALCASPGCPHPARVPDGLCREHAVSRALDEVRDFERGVNFYDPRDWAIERLYLIKEILSLGLSPADLEPTQEPPA